MKFPKKILSIDIGNERIKIVYGSQKKSKLNLLKTVIITTPENSIKDGVLNNKEEIARVIREALIKNKITEKNVVFTISSSKIITREIDLPYLKPNKLKNVVRVNAEEYFPVNLLEYSLDYTITDIVETDSGKQAKLIIFAAQNNLVNMYVELAELIHLKIQCINYSGNSIVSFVKNAQYEGTNLFLDIGAESTLVTIMSKNVVKFSRNLLFGTKIINESIMNHYEVDYEEATKISRERQLFDVDKSSGTSNYLNTDVTSGMEQILQGVSRLVDYYTSRNKNPVEKVFLLGGGAEINGVVDYVEKFFNVKTEKLVDNKSIVYDKKRLTGFEFINFAPSIGALYPSINLLPKQILSDRTENLKKRLSFLFILFLVVILVGIYNIAFLQYNNLVNQKEDIEYQIESMKEINTIIAEHTKVKDKETFRKELDNSSTTRSDYIVDVIDELEKKMPKNSYVLSFQDSDRSLFLEFNAKDEATIAQILTYLKSIEGKIIGDQENPLFSHVYTTGLTRSEVVEGGVTFVAASVECAYYEEEVAK